LRLPSASRIRGRLAYGGVLLVPVRVQGQDFELLVDTGAAYTALSKDVVALLGLTSAPQQTAAIIPAHGGIIRMPVVTIPDLRVGGFRIANVMAVVIEFPSALKLDGMLGMNVLKQFRVTLEIDTGTLVLRPIGQHTPTTIGLGRRP
jgi:clan AA aspartic protease (TIGR02281 family)